MCDDASNPDSDYSLYVLTLKGEPFIKIGITQDPVSRFYQLGGFDRFNLPDSYLVTARNRHIIKRLEASLKALLHEHRKEPAVPLTSGNTEVFCQRVLPSVLAVIGCFRSNWPESDKVIVRRDLSDLLNKPVHFPEPAPLVPEVSPITDNPPQLRAMLLASGDDREVQAQITRAYYGNLEGAKGSPFVMSGILLSSLGNTIVSRLDEVATSLDNKLAKMGTVPQAGAQLLNSTITMNTEAQPPSNARNGESKMDRAIKYLPTEIRESIRIAAADSKISEEDKIFSLMIGQAALFKEQTEKLRQILERPKKRWKWPVLFKRKEKAEAFPPLLQILLSRCATRKQRDAMIEAFYEMFEGDPKSCVIQMGAFTACVVDSQRSSWINQQIKKISFAGIGFVLCWFMTKRSK